MITLKRNYLTQALHSYLLLILYLSVSASSQAIESIEIVGLDSNSSQYPQGAHNPSISIDGTYLAFQKSTEVIINTIVYNYDEIHLRNLKTGQTQRLTPEGGYATHPRISGNGRYILYGSATPNIINGVNDGKWHLYVYDRVSNSTNIIDVSAQGELANASVSGGYAISNDGRYIAYGSDASNLVSDDTNGHVDVFLFDRLLLTVERVSLGRSSEQTVRVGVSGQVNILRGLSDDGRYIFFASNSDTLSPNNVNREFVRDRENNLTSDAILDNNGQVLSDSWVTSVSENGRFVAFSSTDNRLPGHTGEYQAYIYDRATITNQLASIGIDNITPSNQGGGPIEISRGGRYLSFSSDSTNIINNDFNDLVDIFIFDRETGARARLSENNNNIGANRSYGDSTIKSITRPIFSSLADNLVSNDSNSDIDIFMTSNPVQSSSFEFIMAPDSMPYIIDNENVTVRHDVEITNNSDSTQTITLLRRLIAPDNSIWSLGDNNYNIVSNSSLNEDDASYNIPTTFPSGRYEVRYIIFQNGNFIDDGSYFFYKT